MSNGPLTALLRAADCSTLNLWVENEGGANGRLKAGKPAPVAAVAVADVTRKIRGNGKASDDRTESFVFTVRPTTRLSLRSGDIVESLVGAGELVEGKRSGGLVVPERAPVVVPKTGDGTWTFRKLDGGPTLLRVVGVKETGTGPKLKCLQPPNRCDP